MREKVPINLFIIKVHFFQTSETWKEKHSQHPFIKKTWCPKQRFSNLKIKKTNIIFVKTTKEAPAREQNPGASAGTVRVMKYIKKGIFWIN